MKKETLIEIAWDLESKLRSCQTLAQELAKSIYVHLDLTGKKDPNFKELALVLDELANFDLYDFIVNADDDLK